MFTKLFSVILDSSIWGESDPVRIVWMTMLAMVGPDGIVRASPGGLAHRARVSPDNCKKALDLFSAPDVESKDQSYGGRRIQWVDGGWLLLNYKKYRELISLQEGGSATVATPGYVYYAVAGDRVKVGFSKNPWARITDLKAGMPHVLLGATHPGTDSDKTAVHTLFQADHLDHEWFRLSPALLSHIDTIKHGSKPVATVTTPVATVATPVATKEVEGEVEGDTPVASSSRPVESAMYVIGCVTALNQALRENVHVTHPREVAASTQAGTVEWEKDGIPLELAERVIRDRAAIYRPNPRSKQPSSLKYFDAAVREAHEHTTQPRTNGNGNGNGKRHLTVGRETIPFVPMKRAIP